MNFRKWFGLCQHTWVEVERGELRSFNRRTGPYFIYQCEHCKKLMEVS